MMRYGMFILVLFAFLFGMATFIINTPSQSASTAEKRKSSVPDVKLNAAAAETQYKKTCLKCHGNQLQGVIGPSLQKVGRKLTELQIYKQIENGGGVMPSFKGTLDDKTIANLAKWLEQHR